MDKVTCRDVVEQWKQYGVDRSGYIADESPVSNKSILRDLFDLRADEIRTALSTGTELSEFMVQTPPCIKLVEQDRAECVCAPASGCYWLKSISPIPKFIKINSVTGIVAGAENPRFTFIKWDRFGWIPESRNITMRNGCYWTVRETKDGPFLYLYGNRFLEEISVSGLWEDPIAVEAFSNCGKINNNAICNPMDVDFYTDAWLRKYIIAKSWQSLLAAKSQAQVDVINDDSVGNIGAMPSQSK